VRLHGHDEGRQRRFNHAENVRPVAPVDPDFGRLSRIPNAPGPSVTKLRARPLHGAAARTAQLAFQASNITVRLHGNDEDAKRRFNRTENVRPIAPSDPDFTSLFRIRNDAESINRGLEDTLYLRRAHSVGHRRQLVNLLGWALVVNSAALRGHARRAAEPPAA
jgi:hypothetical protein